MARESQNRLTCWRSLVLDGEKFLCESFGSDTGHLERNCVRSLDSMLEVESQLCSGESKWVELGFPSPLLLSSPLFLLPTLSNPQPQTLTAGGARARARCFEVLLPSNLLLSLLPSPLSLLLLLPNLAISFASSSSLTSTRERPYPRSGRERIRRR